MNLLSSALEDLVKNDEAKINIPEVIRHVPACDAGGVCLNKRAVLALVQLGSRIRNSISALLCLCRFLSYLRCVRLCRDFSSD